MPKTSSIPSAVSLQYWSLICKTCYDNAKVTIDLQRTPNLQNILRRVQGFSWVHFAYKNRKIRLR